MSMGKNDRDDELGYLKKRISELEASERRLQSTLFSIFRAAPIGIATIVDRVIMDISERFCKIIGYSRAELIGQNSRILYPSEKEYEDIGKEKYRQIKEQGTGSMETCFRRKDGQILHVLINCTHLDPSDFSAGIMLTVLDITEHRQAERDYQILFQGMLNGFALHEIICDKHGHPVDYRFLAVNPAFERLTGLKATDIEGKTVLEVMPKTEPHWIETYGRVALSGEPLRFENYSQELQKYYTVTAFQTAPNQFACTFDDITECKKTKDALEKRLLALTMPLDNSTPILFEDLFNPDDVQRLQDEFSRATGVASMIIYPDGTPLTRPSNFCRLCSSIIRKTDKGRAKCYRSDAQIGRLCPEGPIVQRCLSCGFWDAGAAISIGGKHIASWLIGQVRDESHTEAEIRTYAREIGADEDAVVKAFYEVPTMSRLRFEQVAQVLFTFANQLSAIAYQNVQQARFITKLKRSEEEKISLEKQFHQAQKLESIGRLAGGVAHDLNNLLTPILGYADMLLEDTVGNNSYQEALEQILNASMRARDLVRQLLAFSRKQTLKFRLADINSLVTNFKKLLRRTIREDVAIQLILAPSLPLIKGDVGQLEQVLMNLAVNAQDAMPDGGELIIETAQIELDENYAANHQDAIPGSHVMLSITDTGCGMNAEICANIFEPFYTTKAKDHGSGLGLATVYGIVKQHGGNVWVYSEPGQGSTFKVYLPVSTELPDNDKKGLKIESKPSSLRSETILLVEDNAQVNDLALAILKREGYTVLSARNGHEALELLACHDKPVQLLLTDVVMPEMNGKQLYNRVSELYPDVEVIYMSGYSDNVIAHRGVMDPGVHFLHKPFSVKALTVKVREALDR